MRPLSLWPAIYGGLTGTAIRSGIRHMGFNKRNMEDARRQDAEKEAAGRRATEKQILEDAEQLVIARWNERQAKRFMPMLFSPTIGAAVTAELLVSAGALPGLPHHRRLSTCGRSTGTAARP